MIKKLNLTSSSDNSVFSDRLDSINELLSCKLELLFLISELELLSFFYFNLNINKLKKPLIAMDWFSCLILKEKSILSQYFSKLWPFVLAVGPCRFSQLP